MGEWRLFSDGVTRPALLGRVACSGGSFCDEVFLIDSGADRSVLSPQLLSRIGLTVAAPAAGTALVGIGGAQSHVLVRTTLEFDHAAGTAVIRGEFAGFTDPNALDMSVLGRDVLNNFDVILSRPRREVLLLAAPHRYRVEP